ncbi:CBL-interacting serine threonine- kinase 7-like [Olea europaea subsp. europaea]|uniref:non-specific serine/threonine protein kinase n=1 Tax=Olea europaea subsp. europaea TaxID=158383 RepID=A0A8S0PWS3_OLEEU|nr:CBL-interacting serine threonine- kinase 7-like [Olea europaea subsp. europaea]
MDHKRSPPPPSSATKITRATRSGGSGSIILEKYKLGRVLGRGSFAKVYHATSLDDNSDVAIKVIDKATTVDAAMEPRIVREVSAMRRLEHHPNILKLHEVMATKTKIYLVMELAPGGELFAKLSRQRRFSESTARLYFHQLVSALIFCHQNGIAHRDIKPQNLLLDNKGLSLEELIKLPWFNKSFSQESLVLHEHQLSDQEFKYLARINAFEIISMSSGLDLSGLFESEMKCKQMRFTSISEVEEIEETVVKIGAGLGYRIERQKGGGIGLVKGRVFLVVEIWEVARELWLVEVKVAGGGGGGDLQWKELKLGLNDIVLSWHNESLPNSANKTVETEDVQS